MPTGNRVPRAVEQLLRDYITSVASVELLIVLREAGTRAQDAGEVATAIRCPESWAASELERLRRHRLVSGNDGRFVLRPGSRDLSAAVDELARIWYTDRRAITGWLFARRSDRRRTLNRR